MPITFSSSRASCDGVPGAAARPAEDPYADVVPFASLLGNAG